MTGQQRIVERASS